MSSINIHVTYIIEKCKDCPFYSGGEIECCEHQMTYGNKVDGNKLDKDCFLLNGDNFISINKELYKG